MGCRGFETVLCKNWRIFEGFEIAHLNTHCHPVLDIQLAIVDFDVLSMVF